MSSPPRLTAAAAAAAVCGRFATLHEVLRWALTQQPEWAVVDVVVQDEYTHDVVLGRTGDASCLVLDAT